MSRMILIARVIGMLVALALAITLWQSATPVDASAKTRVKHGIAISDKGGVAFKCKYRGQRLESPQVLYVCPKKGGYFAFMRTGESFRNFAGFYWKYYPTKRKAIRASERSQYNKYLPTCLNATCTKTKRFY